MFVKLSDIRGAAKIGYILGYWVDDPFGPCMSLTFNVAIRRIGCYLFDESEFNKILKAAKAL